MGAAQAVLWKNLARRRGLLEEYEERPFEFRYLGVRFKLREQPTSEDKRLLHNMAIAIRERINGRPFIDASRLFKDPEKPPNFGIFRRSGAILINGHLAAQVIRGLMKLADEGVIPPIKWGERGVDPYEAERWRRLIGGDGYIKIELLWTKVPEGLYPGTKITFSGRERLAVWRITYDDRCVLIVFRNWANPVHLSRLMMDAAALASLAQRHSAFYPWVRAIIVTTKPESTGSIRAIEGTFKFKSCAARYNPYLAPPQLRKPEPGPEDAVWFPLIAPSEVSVYIHPAAEYTCPKDLNKSCGRDLPISLKEAYEGREELSEYSLELILNAILRSLAIRIKIAEKARSIALNIGGSELLRKIIIECSMKIMRIIKGEPAEATAIKATLQAIKELNHMQKKQQNPTKNDKKTKTKTKQTTHNILMYNFEENEEIREKQASLGSLSFGQCLAHLDPSTHETSFNLYRAPGPPRATWRLLHICNFFFIGFVRGEGWAQPGPFKAKIRVYEKAISRNYKPYKKLIHYHYIVFTDPLGGRYWFPTSCISNAEKKLFSRSLNKFVRDFWKTLETDDKLVEFSETLIAIMALIEMIKAAKRIKARKYKRLTRSFIGLASYHVNLLLSSLFSSLSEVGVPDEPWARRLFLMRLIEWLDAGAERSIYDGLYMYRYRGFMEEDLLNLLSEEEKRGELFPGAPIIDPELPPENYKMYLLHERWIFWMDYVKRAAEKWDNPNLDLPLPDDINELD